MAAENVVECSTCAALVYRASFDAHQKWHDNMARHLEYQARLNNRNRRLR